LIPINIHRVVYSLFPPYTHLLRGNIPNCLIAFGSAIVSNDRPQWVIKHPRRVWFSGLLLSGYGRFTRFFGLWAYVCWYTEWSILELKFCP
jgi:hypothetical protein